MSLALPVPTSRAWTKDAACRGLADGLVDPWAPADDLPAAERGYLWFLGRLICAHCPVRFACAVDALVNIAMHGAYTMRGGLTPQEQRQLAGELGLVAGSPSGRVAQHGTRAKYVTGCHCPPCRRANARGEHARRRRAAS